MYQNVLINQKHFPRPKLKTQIQKKRGRRRNKVKIKGFRPQPKFPETGPQPTNAKTGTPKTPKTAKSKKTQIQKKDRNIFPS